MQLLLLLNVNLQKYIFIYYVVQVTCLCLSFWHRSSNSASAVIKVIGFLSNISCSCNLNSLLRTMQTPNPAVVLPIKEKKDGSTLYYHSLTADPSLLHLSLEEIRLQHWKPICTANTEGFTWAVAGVCI